MHDDDAVTSEDAGVFTSPPAVTPELERCAFYHTMEIPGYGLVQGQWDLRGREREYLGGVDFAGKRVLELGTADGFLCFHMEREGADVVTHDLSKDDSWDMVPFSRHDRETPTPEEWRRSIERLNNGFWLAHSAMGSRARACHGSIYDLPEGIGLVDVSVLGALLLHLRDPFLALQRVLEHTKETVVITGLPWGWALFPTALHPAIHRVRGLLRGRSRPSMTLLPDFRTGKPWDGWWRLPPEMIVEFLGILGFEDCGITFSEQSFEGKRSTVFTIVARRAAPLRAVPSAQRRLTAAPERVDQ